MLDFNNFLIYPNSTNTLHLNYKYAFKLPFERDFDPAPTTFLLQQYWHHSITISVVYFAFIKLIQLFMTNRTAFDLGKPLFFWNAALAVFSWCGLLRMSEEFFNSLTKYGFEKSLCYSCDPFGVAGVWSWLFALSKLVELGDTLFIVLRKRPLIFLHYYHHAAVLIYTIHSGAGHVAAGRWFIWMNFLAHSVMYTYYAVVASGRKLPKLVSMCVTTVQTTQMLVGVFISITVYFIKKSNIPCQQSFENLYLSFLLYVTFAFLFLKFFFNAYIRNTQRKHVKKE